MRIRNPFYAVLLSAMVLADGFCFLSAQQATDATSPQASSTTQSTKPAQSGSATKPGAPAQSAPVWQGSEANRLSRRAEMYYQGVWGVGELRVKTAESGQLIRFNYRVLDPSKAAALSDKKIEPKLLDAQAGVSLVVPQMEKIGALRQSSTPKSGMTYWMAFSNPTLAVKRGHRVDVVIGSFRANNLVVE